LKRGHFSNSPGTNTRSRMKEEVTRLEAIPSKRLFLSIIADYDLEKSICELIDNALDTWVRSGNSNLEIKVELDKDQQTISVVDNAGGVAEQDLKNLVAPGQTGNLPTDEAIGIFGVGTKRAVVALAQDVRITTRNGDAKTFMVEFDDSWLQDEDWTLPYYEVDSIMPSTTVVELQKLRIPLSDDAINRLKGHISSTYARFLSSSKLNIMVNGETMKQVSFEDWAYPPKYLPRKYTGTLSIQGGEAVEVEILGGLSSVSSPATGEYGVYFYCNNRLIARGLKTYDVGYTTGLAGLPHPSISLVRVIVSLRGPAELMPWNSSKSAISPNHRIFAEIRDRIIEVVKYYSSVSRALEGSWNDSVFKYNSGNIQTISLPNFTLGKLRFPPVPRSKPRYGDLVIVLNQATGSKRPWTVGLYEGIVAVDWVYRQNFVQKNRICLILLDSLLEIAFKEYLVNESGQPYNDQRLLALFRNREDVHSEIKQYTNISIESWGKISYYYRMRSKLIHERAGALVSDHEVNDFRKVVQDILNELFGLAF